MRTFNRAFVLAVAIFGVFAAPTRGQDAPAVLRTPSAADDRGTWSPGGIRASNDSLTTVLARLHESNDAAGTAGPSAIDQFTIQAGGQTVSATATVRGNDYTIDSTLEGEHVRIGRFNGERWRENGAGTIHIVRADTQGDDFDRWPIAVLGFEASECSLAGEASIPQRTWVLAVRPPRDIRRWLYVDAASGDIVREISREGSRIETYDFDDIRGAAGARRIFGWHINGRGGPERVALASSTPSAIAATDVQIPPQGPPPFSIPTAVQSLNVTIAPTLRILVDVIVNGKHTPFQLDSGTPQIVLNDEMTRRAGKTLLGHGLIHTLDAQGNVAADMPFSQIDFFLGGLLGYDFFRGRIVHVDYPHDAADVEPRAGFTPPPDAHLLPTDWSEGMPLVTATINGVTGDRFVIDLGSPDILVSKAFASRLPPSAYDKTGLPRSGIRYLEGPVEFQQVTLDDFTLGSFRIEGPPAMLEIPNQDNIAIPVDGVIGMRQIARFEWWFDADGGSTWYRLRG